MIYLEHDLRNPVEYCTSGKFLSESGGAVHPRRNLDTFVILFGSTGRYDICQDGREYSLTPGTFLLLFPHHEHYGIRPCEPKLSHYWCHFYIHDNYKLTDDSEYRDMTDIEKDPDILVLPEFGSVSSHEKLRLLFHQLIDSSHSAGKFRNKICNWTLSVLLSELSDAFLRENSSFGATNRATVTQVVEWIRLNALEINSVGDVAGHFGYNGEYLTTIIRKETSKSLTDHITVSKVNEAKKLLLCSNLTVKEIAYRCGFTDDKYFMRVFKKISDITPSEYRKVYFNMHYNRQ